MINYHKLNFFDCKRLVNMLSDKGYFLYEYNPFWLFLYSDYLKPEVSFTNEFTYIKIHDSEAGMIYYPPYGNGNLKMSLLDLEEEAKADGFEFNLGPVTEDVKRLVEASGYKLYDNKNLAPYVVPIADFLANGKYIKKNASALKKFENNHKKNLRFRILNKEDFPLTLEFIGSFKDKTFDLTGERYFRTLNMIKKAFDHLYELGLTAMILEDDEGIYGMIIGSVVDNASYVHLDIAVDETGAYEELIAAYAKYLATKARYLVFDSTGDSEKIKRREKLNGSKPASYFATYNL